MFQKVWRVGNYFRFFRNNFLGNDPKEIGNQNVEIWVKDLKCQKVSGHNMWEIYGVIGGRWQAQRICRVEMIWCRKLRIYQLDRRRDLHLARIQQVVIVTHFLATALPLLHPSPPSHDPLELTLTCSFYWWELGRGQILGSEEYLCKQHCSSECVGNPLNASVFWHFKEPSINIITIAKDKITIIGKNKQKTLGSSPLHSKMQICISFDCHILPQESCGPGNPQTK